MSRFHLSISGRLWDLQQELVRGRKSRHALSPSKRRLDLRHVHVAVAVSMKDLALHVLSSLQRLEYAMLCTGCG